MKKFKVKASYITYCTAEIEAENEDEAYEIARSMDGGDFDPESHGEDWNIYDLTEIED